MCVCVVVPALQVWISKQMKALRVSSYCFRHRAPIIWEVHMFAYKPLMYVYNMYFELQYVA